MWPEYAVILLQREVSDVLFPLLRRNGTDKEVVKVAPDTMSWASKDGWDPDRPVRGVARMREKGRGPERRRRC